MKMNELLQKSKEELKDILNDNREKLRQIRFNLAIGKVKNVREIRKIKKEIAQILTIFNRSEIIPRGILNQK